MVRKMIEVTDPQILAKLNSSDNESADHGKLVTDPQILAQLEGSTFGENVPRETSAVTQETPKPAKPSYMAQRAKDVLGASMGAT